MAETQSYENLLQSALSSAFSPPSLAPAPVSEPSTTTSSQPPAEPAQVVSESESLVSREELDKWEEERLSTETRWKEESAVQRRETEERRAKIAAERLATGQTWEKVEEGKDIPGPPNPLNESLQTSEEEEDVREVERPAVAGYSDLPRPIDATDVIVGEPPKMVHGHELQSSSETSGLEHSQHWTEIDDVPPSMSSSFPSLSYPENTSSSPSEKSHGKTAAARPAGNSKPASHRRPSPHTRSSTAPPDPPPSVTLAIFDSRLSSRSRIIAFASSVSINLFLPFVNGVMLGFGEIFAKGVARKFFGYTGPLIRETAVGSSSSRRK